MIRVFSGDSAGPSGGCGRHSGYSLAAAASFFFCRSSDLPRPRAKGTARYHLPSPTTKCSSSTRESVRFLPSPRRAPIAEERARTSPVNALHAPSVDVLAAARNSRLVGGGKEEPYGGGSGHWRKETRYGGEDLQVAGRVARQAIACEASKKRKLRAADSIDRRRRKSDLPVCLFFIISFCNLRRRHAAATRALGPW